MSSIDLHLLFIWSYRSYNKHARAVSYIVDAYHDQLTMYLISYANMFVTKPHAYQYTTS